MEHTPAIAPPFNTPPAAPVTPPMKPPINAPGTAPTPAAKLPVTVPIIPTLTAPYMAPFLTDVRILSSGEFLHTKWTANFFNCCCVERLLLGALPPEVPPPGPEPPGLPPQEGPVHGEPGGVGGVSLGPSGFPYELQFRFPFASLVQSRPLGSTKLVGLFKA